MIHVVRKRRNLYQLDNILTPYAFGLYTDRGDLPLIQLYSANLYLEALATNHSPLIHHVCSNSKHFPILPLYVCSRLEENKRCAREHQTYVSCISALHSDREVYRSQGVIRDNCPFYPYHVSDSDTHHSIGMSNLGGGTKHTVCFLCTIIDDVLTNNRTVLIFIVLIPIKGGDVYIPRT